MSIILAAWLAAQPVPAWRGPPPRAPERAEPRDARPREDQAPRDRRWWPRDQRWETKPRPMWWVKPPVDFGFP